MNDSVSMVQFDAARAALTAASTIDEVKVIRDQAEAIRAYLKQQKGSLEVQNQAAAIKIRAERRLGEMAPEIHTAERGRPNGKTAQPEQFLATTWEDLKLLGISRGAVARWQKEAEVSEAMVDAYIARCEADETEATTAGFLRFANDSGGYDGNEWYTPAAEVEMVRRVLGEIDLDPASCEYAQRTVQALAYFTKEDDALARDWPGRVFLNPPYSHPEVEYFTRRLIEQFEAGITTAAICLVNNCTDAKWFQALIQRYPVCFTDGRIYFEREGTEKFATRQGQAFFYLGRNPDLFDQVFDGPVGTVGVAKRLIRSEAVNAGAA